MMAIPFGRLRTIGLFEFALLAVLTMSFAAPSAAATKFIGDVGDLERTPDSQFDELYKKQSASLSGYRQVYIAPVGVIFDKDKTLKEYSERDLTGRQTYFADALTESLGQKFEIVDQPGSGVLTVEAAFTSLQTNKLSADQLREANPQLSAFNSFAIGRAAFQASVKDGATGELLLAVADSRRGQDLRHNFRNRWRVWGDVNDAINLWARELPDRIN